MKDDEDERPADFSAGQDTIVWAGIAMPRLLIVIVGVAFAGGAAHAQRVDRLVIFERGQYTARSSVASPRGGTTGQVRAVRNPHLIASTTAIPARRNSRFGLRYVVHGEPRGAPVELRMVTRFPDAGIRDPATGRRSFTDEYRISVQFGAANYRDYHIDEEWEAVPGRWVFEFWLDGRKLKEQEFCLFAPAKPPVNPCTQAISQALPR